MKLSERDDKYLKTVSPEFGLINKVISVMTNRCILEQFPDIADKLRHTAHSMTAFEVGLLRSPVTRDATTHHGKSSPATTRLHLEAAFKMGISTFYMPTCALIPSNRNQ